jgi:hypothetical protein
VSVDNPSIDDDIPEVWRARAAGDIRLVHALSTPGLPDAILARSHVAMADVFDTIPASDEAKARAAAAIIALKQPALRRESRCSEKNSGQFISSRDPGPVKR